MVSKDKLKEYANKLMFDMADKEYETLQQEFEIFLKQMELIGEIDDIKGIEPMTFPFIIDDVRLRDDTEYRAISNDEAFANCHGKKGRDVKVPRVVE